MENESKIKALLQLLDDDDNEVWELASNELSQLNIQYLDVLPQMIDELELGENAYSRLDEIYNSIKGNFLTQELSKWKSNESSTLAEGMVIISKLKYPDYTLHDLNQSIDSLRLDAWLEFHYDLTSFEKVKILNYILFQLHGFKGNEEDFLNPNNSYINKVLETKKGNPISLSIIYILVAQRLNVPVYGVNLPKHFIMAYVEDDETNTISGFGDKQMIGEEAKGKVQFYINAYNGGGVFNEQQLLKSIKDMNLELEESYTIPCSSYDIVKRVLKNLYNSYLYQNNPMSLVLSKVIESF